jgi:hypothetical protein
MHGAIHHLRDSIAPYREDPNPWIAIPALLHDPGERLAFDLPALGFLVGSNDLNVLTNLVLTERRFRATIAVVEERSALHREMLQPAISDNQQFLPPSGARTSMDIAAVLPERVVGTMESATSGMLRMLDENEGHLRLMYAQLRSALKSVHPRQKFYTVDFERSR